MQRPAMLALEDGTVFRGRSFGAEGERDGEVVFNTAMTGYPEVLTDPSYRGQMVCMTYPLIGNYGITEEDFESRRIWLSGFLVKENSRLASNWRSRYSLADFLKKHDVPGIEGIDTRRLVKHIREAGAMKAVLSTEDLAPESLAAKAKAAPGMVGIDYVADVSAAKAYAWGEPLPDPGFAPRREGPPPAFRVVALDFGIKHNILRGLVSHGCEVTVLPASTPAETILEGAPDGVFLSNGPGDPAYLPHHVETIRHLLGNVPLFGICLGHQLLTRALGGKTYKLKFGHHGGNQPVMRLDTRQVEITSQNHNYATDQETTERMPVVATHLNLNDETLEGIAHRELPVFSVQYHPESAPGPHDSRYLFARFAEMMRTGKSGAAVSGMA